MATRIVLLTNPGPECRALAVRMVQQGCPPGLIVLEEARTQYPYSWPSRAARWAFGDAFVDRLAQRRLPMEQRETIAWERSSQLASTQWLKEATHGLVPNGNWPQGIPQLRTANVNDPATVERVRGLQPDLLVVYGTGLLRSPLLEIPARGTLNCHSSLLPHYRGARSEFWQCFNDDPRYVGITVHIVDTKVDTGDILFQHATRSTWPSDPYRLRAANIVATLDHYPMVIHDHLAGRSVPGVQGTTETPTYRMRDMTMEARLALKKRIAG